MIAFKWVTQEKRKHVNYIQCLRSLPLLKGPSVLRDGKIGIVCFYQLNTATFSDAQPGLLPACTVQRQEQPQVGQESVCTLAGSV